MLISIMHIYQNKVMEEIRMGHFILHDNSNKKKN